MLTSSFFVNLQDDVKYCGYATVCIVCLKRITECELFKCSGCKLVFYCSKEHQKLNWRKHKQLCKAVQLIIERTDGVGLYDDYDGKGEVMWHAFRLSIRTFCENMIKRKLTREELAVLYNPFACNICHVHKHKCMITCSNCCVVSYCSVEHQIQDKANHALNCDELQFSLDFDRNCHKPFFLKAHISEVTALPDNMRTFIKKFVETDTEPYVNKLYSSCYISNSLTVPLTLIYALEKSKVFHEKDILKIHVVGCGPFESAAYWCWEYIFHYFNNISTINFSFIGPESSKFFLPPILMCSRCKNSKSFNFVVDSRLYHDYIKDITEAPDVIVAFNCGFHEFKFTNNNHDTWKDSCQSLCSFPGCLLIFTSYLHFESVNDLKVLNEFSKIGKRIMLAECEENPFKSMIPFHECYSEKSSVYYNNNFINILIT